ncbi:hypothetical protein BCR34DRAFT_655918 [Clohesyomyces aquaticus]|uniref:Uncharacterized protein n=1 Tax=Clohesyomyces aquaticus TaxID=1231657 RepID=A0A1Y2A6R9_9PLEO|nr:hypothetical protein BCR34DRAFT_655918 [Clohesyomyces aquaticus]
MTTYSPWVWSAEHDQYYCCSYDDKGDHLGYHWSGPQEVRGDQPTLRSYGLANTPRTAIASIPTQSYQPQPTWGQAYSNYSGVSQGGTYSRVPQPMSRWFRVHEWDGPKGEPFKTSANFSASFPMSRSRLREVEGTEQEIRTKPEVRKINPITDAAHVVRSSSESCQPLSPRLDN